MVLNLNLSSKLPTTHPTAFLLSIYIPTTYRHLEPNGSNETVSLTFLSLYIYSFLNQTLTSVLEKNNLLLSSLYLTV